MSFDPAVQTRESKRNGSFLLREYYHKDKKEETVRYLLASKAGVCPTVTQYKSTRRIPNQCRSCNDNNKGYNPRCCLYHSYISKQTKIDVKRVKSILEQLAQKS